LGEEAPATVDSCHIGWHVRLRGGTFKDAVFLEGAGAGSGAHVRGGTILEEGVSIAHCVGLKQSILFPYVTLGSLINFCDVFMAGGTGPKNHSEVGSSYIHFNFTPHQDKATPSMLGDVPRGVMLDRFPIFLGGQGGLVGPCRLEYGTVIAAGTICRKDELRPDRLISEGGGRSLNVPFRRGVTTGLRRIVTNNIVFMANLLALRHWYRYSRNCFVDPERFPEDVLQALIRTVETGIEERMRRLGELPEKLTADAETSGKKSSSLQQQIRELQGQTDAVGEVFRKLRNAEIAPGRRDAFLKGLETAIAAGGKRYTETIASLSPETKTSGTRWLQAIVDEAVAGASVLLPSFSLS
jgi:UDP-N-acetylglucosamine/UDP-N-acetylgalactosamine diphosphorylase